MRRRNAPSQKKRTPGGNGLSDRILRGFSVSENKKLGLIQTPLIFNWQIGKTAAQHVQRMA